MYKKDLGMSYFYAVKDGDGGMHYIATRQTNELWLTEIPDHWDIRKIKYVFTERVEKGYPNEPLLVASQNMGVVPKNVYGNRTVEAMKDLQNLKLVRVGDFVISLRSFQGGIEYAYYQGIISPAYTVMVPNNHIIPGYFRFLSKSRLFIELLQMCVTGIREGQNIDYNKLKNHHIPLPPYEEQDQIVRYLDWKVSQINKLINIKRRQIALLKEQKRAVIVKATNKGLNKSKMINSGIKEIGDLPADWSFSVGKRIFTLFGGSVPDNELSIVQKFDWKKNYYFTVNTMNHTKYGFEMVYDNSMFFMPTKYIPFSAPLLLIPKRGGAIYTNKVRISNRDCLVDPNIMAIRVKGDIYYYAYFLFGRTLSDVGDISSVPQINNKHINHLYVLIPPIAEQNKIVEYLNQQCLRIDKVINNLYDEITMFTEYRTRHISDVASGKLNVWGVVVPKVDVVVDVADDGDAEAVDEVEDME